VIETVSEKGRENSRETEMRKGRKAMNGKKTLVFGLIALLCVGTGAFAMTVGYQGGGIGELTLSDLTTQPPGLSLVALGNFGGMADSAIAALADPSAVWAAFSKWDNTFTDSDNLTFGTAATTAGGAFLGTHAYLVAFNSGTYTTASAFGVFKGPNTGASNGQNWIFPLTDTLPAVTYDLGDVGAGGVIIGSFGSLTLNSAWYGDYADAYGLKDVPEPSTMMLVGTGLLGLLAIRRRS